MKITSRDNQRLKFARKVRDEKIKDKIFIEGIRLVEEALEAGLEIVEGFYSGEFVKNKRTETLIENIRSEKIGISEVSENIFKSITDTKTSQGIVLIAQTPTTGKEIIEANLIHPKNRFSLFILLHQINNPANLGAILRTAKAVGVEGIILTKNSASPFSPKALRSAMGASFDIPIWKDADFSEILRGARSNGFVSICADINSEKNYLETDFKRPILLVLGSEAHGLSPEERDLVDESVKILLENGVESLNLAVACSVILFEAKRQRSKIKF